MTLLEVLIALSIFAVSSLYIGRTIKSTFAKKRHIETKLKEQNIKRNLLEIMREDLKGVQTFFDINAYLNKGYNFLNPQFIFEGEGDTLKFTSKNFIPAETPDLQLTEVKYSMESCGANLCLFRHIYTRDLDENKINSKKQILIRDLKSIRFLYYNPDKVEWEKDWSLSKREQESKDVSEYTSYTLLPTDVRLELIWQDNKIEYHTLHVSHYYLRHYHGDEISPLTRAVLPKEQNEKQ